MDTEHTQAYKIILKFTITDFLGSPDLINEQLRLTPKHTAEQGKSLNGRPVARKSVWSFWIDVADENDLVEEQWKIISHSLQENKDLLKIFAEKYKLKFSVVAHANTDFPPITIPLSMIEFCSSIGAFIDVDLFGDLKNGDYE